MWLTEFGDSAIQFELLIWIEDPEDGLGSLRSDLLKSIWEKFKADGVEIPFPQSDIRIKEWPASPTVDLGAAQPGKLI